jgi:hypothetical protein
MKSAIISVGITSFLGIVVNIVSDNVTNPWAWLILVVAVVIAAVLGILVEKKMAQNIKIKGYSNELEQTSSRKNTQNVDIKGSDNKVKQTLKN